MVARQTSNMIDSWWQDKRQPWLTNGDKVVGGKAGNIREHCYSCVEVLGKLLAPCCLWPPSSNGYLVKSAADVLNSPPRDIPGKANGWVLRSQTLHHCLLQWQDLKTQDSTHFKSVNIFCTSYTCALQLHTLIRNTGSYRIDMNAVIVQAVYDYIRDSEWF